jgi:hypothetical protein
MAFQPANASQNALDVTRKYPGAAIPTNDVSCVFE